MNRQEAASALRAVRAAKCRRLTERLRVVASVNARRSAETPDQRFARLCWEAFRSVVAVNRLPDGWQKRPGLKTAVARARRELALLEQLRTPARPQG